MSESSHAGTARSQLERLATLTDVVYAVALVVGEAPGIGPRGPLQR